MSHDYHLYLRREALEFLEFLPQKERTAVWRFLEYLEKNPDGEGDFQEKDISDRELAGIVLGKYAIIYWADHAVKEVKVTEIQFADE